WGMCVSAAMVWGVIAVRSLRKYRRYGRVPLSLSLSKASRVLRIQAQGSGRWREFPLASVKEVNVNSLRSLVPRHSVAEMVIRFRGLYFPIRQRFKGDDVLLAERFATELKKAMSARTGVDG